MSHRRVRAAAACTFCRKKKLKCDALKPSCSNCLAKGLDCRPSVVQHKPRPTNRRIEHLERENEALRQQCIQLHNGYAAASDGQPGVTNTTAESSTSIQSSARAISLSEESEGYHGGRALPLYHGPTSTIYDGPSTQVNTSLDGRRLRHPADKEWIQFLLFSKTAKQRQKEPLDLLAGRLDFDGVEPEIGMHLLSIYWSRQLFTAQIVYRPTFMRDMACNGPFFSKLLLNAIFFAVSKHCTRREIYSDPDDINTAGWRFRLRFAELLRDSFDKSEIPTLQALLIMSNTLFSRCDERSLSWLYAGNAFNMIIDLGLHSLPSPGSISAEELELRRRVLWGAYAIDKIQALLQGRPPLLHRINFKASLEFLDEYDELEPLDDSSYATVRNPSVTPSLNVSLLIGLCELSLVIERILSEIYSEFQETAGGTIQSRNSSISEDIDSKLNKWRHVSQLDQTSTSGIRTPVLPQSLCLSALANAMIILSYRPAIGNIQDRESTTATTHQALSSCTIAADQIVLILRDYSRRFSIIAAPYVLLYATYVSATIHARVAAYKGPGSKEFRSLFLCCDVLNRNTYLYAAAGRAKESLDKLIAQLGVNIADSNCSSEDPSANIIEEPATCATVFPVPDFEDQTPELDLTQPGDLSDFDIEALARGFQFAGDLDHLMHHLGT